MAGSDLMQLFYSGINAKAQEQLGNLLHGTITPIELGSQGDFPWFWQDANGNFNANTFDYLSRRATPGQHGGVALGDSFLNAYSGSLQDLTWKLSAADQTLLNQTQLAASVQAGAVVTAYQQAMGAITSDQIAAAAKVLGYQPQKLDYVLGYAVGYQWSGQALKTGAAPLSYQTLASTRNLNSVLPNMPPTAGSVLPAVTNYLQVTNSIVSLEDSSSNAMWIRGQLLNNTQQPSLTNGGVQTVSSNGALAVRPGYTVNMAPADISNSLANAGTSLTITMNAARESANEMSVDIEGHTGFTLPLDFIGISLSASAQYSLFEASGSGAAATVAMTFPGLTVVPVGPSGWQQDTSTNSTVGWFYKTPIAQAAAAGTGTGWSFSPMPPYDFAAGGDFGWLAALVISGYPTITITYTEGSYAEFSKTFAQKFSAEVSLFGIPLGGGSESTFSGESSSSSQDGTFTITMTPPPQTATVNALDQRAYVIGAQVSYATPAASALRSSAAVVGGTPPKLALAHSAPVDAAVSATVKLGGVSFTNRAGFPMQIFTMAGQTGTHTQLAAWQTSAALNGTLLTVDVVHPNQRYSYDMSRFLPNGLLVSDESPYRLAQVIGRDGRTLELAVSDCNGGLVGSVKPAVLAA